MHHLIDKCRVTLCVLLATITPVLSHALSTQSFEVTTFSILSYANWKTIVTTPTLCVVDNPALATQFKTVQQQNGHKYNIIASSLNTLDKSSCNILFFSTLSPKAEQKVLNSYNTPPLSFSSNNITCEIGSSFCLYRKKQHTSFKVNMSSLSETAVHVDPRVLLLAKSMEQ